MSEVTVYPVRSEADHDRALRDIESLMEMGVRPGTPEGDRLDVLVGLVERYEQENHAIEAPDPIALLEHVMDARGLTRRDLQEALGPSGRVSEVLNRRRPLTLSQIRRLHRLYDLPADVLVREYPVAQ